MAHIKIDVFEIHGTIHIPNKKLEIMLWIIISSTINLVRTKKLYGQKRLADLAD